MKKSFRFRLIIAIFWLLLIYTFLPFTPKFFNFLIKQISFPSVQLLLVFLSLGGVLLVYLPFVRKFRLNRILPYVIITVVLAIACAVNIALATGFELGPNIKIRCIPARTLHIPEYAILSVLLYSAFIVKYTSKKSCCLAAAAGIIAGIIDERLIQYLLPMRYYDTGDILLNIAGVVTGIILISAYRLKGYNT